MKRRNVNDTKVSTMTTNLYDFVVKKHPYGSQIDSCKNRHFEIFSVIDLSFNHYAIISRKSQIFLASDPKNF